MHARRPFAKFVHSLLVHHVLFPSLIQSLPAYSVIPVNLHSERFGCCCSFPINA